MSGTDSMIRRLEVDFNEQQTAIDTIAEQAAKDDRDLTPAELEIMHRAQARQEEITKQIVPLEQAAKVSAESRKKLRDAHEQVVESRRRGDLGPIEYRSAGEYIADLYSARMGDAETQQRIEVYHRAAAHQTTADNPGLLPERIVGPVINGIDAARPLVNAIGVDNLGPGSWAYARVTQGTSVAAQSAEKAELASQKMTVTKTAITAPTYGGYVNISRQDIRRTSGGIVDMVINDLQGRYAIATEDSVCADLETAATNSTLDIPATPTALQVSQSVWAAAGQSAALMRTANLPATGPILVVAPDQLGVIGPLFPLVNPQNAASTGFNAADASMQGAQGAISGLTVVMGLNLTAGKILFLYRSGVKLFEDRYGVLQVDEPSVLGMQVGVAGDFETIVLGGVINIEHS